MGGVIAVIGARLNSSRLPGKHLLDLAGAPLIARIFERLERIAELDHIVLATTADDYNQPLVEWAQRAGKAVFAFEGDVNDVVGRVDAVVRQYDADIVVYVCGDSPLIDPGTLDAMIRVLLENPGADHVALEAPLTGRRPIHEGFYPYRRRTWQRLVEAARDAAEREHVGSSLRHISGGLNTVSVRDDPVYSRVEQRISVDTPADYRFMAELYRRWYAQHQEETIVSLAWIIDELERDAGLARINRHVRQKGVDHQAVNILLVTQCDAAVGLGHLVRTLRLAGGLMEYLAAGVFVLVQGPATPHPGLALLRHGFVAAEQSISTAMLEHIDGNPVDAVIFDLVPTRVPDDMAALLHALAGRKIARVAIDGLFDQAEQLSMIHVPSFFLASDQRHLAERGMVGYGWDHYLLGGEASECPWSPGPRLLVMSGAADVARLGALWPPLLDRCLPDGTEIHWVRGPYAAVPELPARPTKRWLLHENPADMAGLLRQADYGLAQYGVSLFELLQLGVPCVAVPRAPDSDEMRAFAREDVAVVATAHQAVAALAALMDNPPLARRLSAHAWARLGQADGAAVLARRLKALLQEGSA